MNAKIHKILGHKYCDTPYIVWMDGNCQLKEDPHKLIKLMGNKDFAFFKHPGRDCLFQEADTCIELGKGNRFEIAEQIKEYAKIDFPPKAGLCECTFFIRKNTPNVNWLFESWWAEVSRYSERDQISFPVIFRGQQWATIPGSVAKAQDFKMDDPKGNFPGNNYFKLKAHKK